MQKFEAVTVHDATIAAINLESNKIINLIDYWHSVMAKYALLASLDNLDDYYDNQTSMICRLRSRLSASEKECADLHSKLDACQKPISVPANFVCAAFDAAGKTNDQIRNMTKQCDAEADRIEKEASNLRKISQSLKNIIVANKI
jgi:histidinol-phosphate/aromatic aminotransferase/cobyric acid decarboxylase-like protein